MNTTNQMRDDLAGARESITSGELFTGVELYPFKVDLGEAVHKLKAEVDVMRRERDDLAARLAQAREVLSDCATTLEGYARHHAERGPEHAHKVTRNAELAARCRAALAAKE